MNQLSNLRCVNIMNVVVKINKSMEIQFWKFPTLAAEIHFTPTLFPPHHLHELQYTLTLSWPRISYGNNFLITEYVLGLNMALLCTLLPLLLPAYYYWPLSITGNDDTI